VAWLKKPLGDFSASFFSILMIWSDLATPLTSVEDSSMADRGERRVAAERWLFLPLAALFLFVPQAKAQSGPGLSRLGANGTIPTAEYAAVQASKVVSVLYTTEPIDFDGRLDEPVWQLATVAGDFIQYNPLPGAPAIAKTEVRFLYDEENLYVGYFCFDSQADRMSVLDLREDFDFAGGDAVSLIVDSLHDRRSGFAFSFNPAGARRDGQISNDGRSNFDWDGVWDVRTSRNEDGWTAELVVPFKTLRFSGDEMQEWGVNMTRRVPSINEESNWAPVPVRFRATKVSLAGTLIGLEDLSQGINLKIKPFATAGMTQVRVGDQMQTVRSLDRFDDYDGGVDVKYSLTPSMTLDATYRTDFAQVEADQQQVNLTRFNLFFPEKRDFFLENSGTFNFGPGGNLLPFFSRRIGLTQSGTQIPIVGGARLSGQMGQYDFGFLAMKTESAATPQGQVPSNSFTVGRIKRNLLRTSWVGAIVTNRDSTTPGDYNRVYGADAHFLFNDKLEFDTYLLKSQTPGLSGQDQARRFEAAWRDDELLISGEYNGVQENFNPEVGFVRRGDLSQYIGEFEWSPLIRTSPLIRNVSFGTSLDYIQNGSGDLETREQRVSAGVSFENSASATFTLTQTFDRLIEPTRIQGVTLPVGDYTYRLYSFGFRTNSSRKVSANANMDWGEFWDGDRTSFRGTVSWKPDYHFSAELSYNRNQVTLNQIRVVSDLVGARLLYSFTARAFLNAFFQYNGSTHEVSSNIRFNWTYRPLSDIYIVYNDRRDARNNMPLERALIIKLTRLITF
jgi:hypothetical protein